MEDVDNGTMEESTVSSRDTQVKREIFRDSTNNLGRSLENGDEKIPISQVVQELGEAKKSLARGDPRTSSKKPSVPSAGSSLLETMRVYVRVKPFPKGVKLTKEQQLLYQVDKSSLFINLSDVKQDMTKNVDVVGKHFVFSEAFGGDANQSKVFERVVEPQVDQLFDGKSFTVMTYGATGSGKSHTLEGSHTNPGLIPKTLEDIFSLGKPKSTPRFRPKANEIECLPPAESLLELESTKEFLSSLPRKEPYLQEVCDPPDLNGRQIHHEVWISFVELRDEIYYDLLSHDYQTKHSPVKMFTDDEGKAFIKDLRHVSVRSAAEAKDVLTIGRLNLMRLYSMSSQEICKSHCIFTIILLKYEDGNQAESVQMSRFSFCDLAAHRSPEIDTSLLSLTRCLKFTNEHNHPESVSKNTEYFCHSKLTRLFEDALTGKEHFSLIVNVDPNPGMYRETQAVLHSTAITSEVLTKIRHQNNPKVTTNFGQIALKSAIKINDWDDLQGDKIMEVSADFNMDIAKLKVLNLRSDFQIRETMVKRYTSMIERIDKAYKRRLSLISPVVKIKKKNENSEEVELNSMEIPESEDIAALKTMLDTLRTRKQMVERDLKAVEIKLNSIPPELYEICDALENNKDPALKIFDMEMELKNRKDKNDEFNKLLSDAREEILRLTNEAIEDKKKIGDIERKYVALKFDRDNEFVIHKSSKYAYARLLKMLSIKEMEIMREMELRKGVEVELRKESEMKVVKEVELRKERRMKLCKVVELCKGQGVELVKREGGLRKEVEMELCKKNEKEVDVIGKNVELCEETELRKEAELRERQEMKLLKRKGEIRKEDMELRKEVELCEWEIGLRRENQEEIEVYEQEVGLDEKKVELNEQEVELDEQEVELHGQDIELHGQELELHEQVTELDERGVELHKQVTELHEQDIELHEQDIELYEQEMELHNEKEKATESLENVSTAVNPEKEEELMETEQIHVPPESVNTTDPEVPLALISESEIVSSAPLNPSQTIPETSITLANTVEISTTETIESPETIPVITVSDIETITLTDESSDVPSAPENQVHPPSETSTPGFTTDVIACPGLRINALEAKIFSHLEAQIFVPEIGVPSLPEPPLTEMVEVLDPEGCPVPSGSFPSIQRDLAPIDLIGPLKHVPEGVENELDPSDEITSPATSSSTYASCKSHDSILTDDFSKSTSDESSSPSESGNISLRRSTRKRHAATFIPFIQSSVKRAKPKEDVPVFISCDSCESVIRNQERYHCMVCEDYDLCLECYRKVVHNHELKMLPTPQ